MSVYQSLPPNLVAVDKSAKGYINHEVLYKYLCNAFDQWLTDNSIQRAVIVRTDKHKSWIQFHVAKKLKDLQTILILILPNATHFMQPLGVGLFGPMKSGWTKVVDAFRLTNPNGYVLKENFAGLFLPFYNQYMALPKTKKAFDSCGLHSFNADKPNYSKLTLHEVHSADARIFEEVLQDGYVETSTQVDCTMQVDVRTQTGTSIFSDDIGIGLGINECSGAGYIGYINQKYLNIRLG